MSVPNDPSVASTPATGQPGRFNAVGGRFSVEPTGDDPYYNKPFGRTYERNFDATGYYSPIMAVPQVNAWQKGELYRKASPALKLTWFGPMYDPTNPADWAYPV